MALVGTEARVATPYLSTVRRRQRGGAGGSPGLTGIKRHYGGADCNGSQWLALAHNGLLLKIPGTRSWLDFPCDWAFLEG